MCVIPIYDKNRIYWHVLVWLGEKLVKDYVLLSHPVSLPRTNLCNTSDWVKDKLPPSDKWWTETYWPFLGLEFRRWVSWNEEQSSHWMHLTKSCNSHTLYKQQDIKHSMPELQQSHDSWHLNIYCHHKVTGLSAASLPPYLRIFNIVLVNITAKMASKTSLCACVSNTGTSLYPLICSMVVYLFSMSQQLWNVHSRKC